MSRPGNARRLHASGTEGYAAEASALVQQYESLAFADVHRAIAHLFPPPPAAALDIGAGTGRDAAGFAALGYQVVAAEPTAELRCEAMQLHPSPAIEWADDALPNLPGLAASGRTFDLVMLTAVWMHLDEGQRRRAMSVVARLVCPAGLLALSLRHGPVPPGRRMFDVSADETVALAIASGLAVLHRTEDRDGLLQRPGVTWDRLAFRMS